MANHPESSDDPETPSVDEAINWLMDSLLGAGVVGFSDDYIAPKDCLQNWTATPSDEGPQGAPGNALMLKRFLNESHAEETLMHQRIEIVNADKGLRQRAKVEVYRRLLASGMSEKEIAETTGKRATLTTMAKILYERQNPKPRAIETVLCRVVTGLPGTVGLSPIRLPRKASLRVIYELLREFVSNELLCTSPKVMPEELDDILSAWRYQIVTENSKGKVVLKDRRCVLLKHDLDYQDMIKKVTTSDLQTLFPLLTPVNPATPKPNFQANSAAPAEIEADVEADVDSDETLTETGDCPNSGREEGEADRAWDEWVQAEGFKPVDWKEVAKRISQGVDVMDYSFPENWGT